MCVGMSVCVCLCMNLEMHHSSALLGPAGDSVLSPGSGKLPAWAVLFLGWTAGCCKCLRCCCRGHPERVVFHKGVHSRSGPTANTVWL